jgi:hypothetical protein
LTDYNNTRELERTQGWTNTEVILKRDIYSLGIVLSSEAILQGKTVEIYTSTIPGRMEGSKTGVLTYKELYEANKISKEEYESTKGWSIGYQAAAWSEYVGPVVGGTSTYIAGKNGLLNQNNLETSKDKTSNDILYSNKKELQDPYYGPKQKVSLIDGKYKDTNTGYTMKGNYIYVIDEKGNLRIANIAKLTQDQGHTSLSGGQPVKYAGTMKFNNKGQLVKWTNESGHYEPNTFQAPEISGIFESLGIPDATMDKFVPFSK